MRSSLERRCIKSHQQNKESLAVKMNDWVDRLAAEQRHNTIPCYSKWEVNFLPHKEVQLVLQGNTYDRDLGQKLRQHVHGHDAEECIAPKQR